jgi:4-alpha-glucanotransferase
MGLGSEARMNTPGTVDGNWRWRFAWDDLNRPDVARFRAAVTVHRPS